MQYLSENDQLKVICIHCFTRTFHIGIFDCLSRDKSLMKIVFVVQIYSTLTNKMYYNLIKNANIFPG